MFESIWIIPKTDTLVIQWELKNQSEPGNYFFNIYRSENPENGFTKVNYYPIINDFKFEFPFFFPIKTERLFIQIELIFNEKKYLSNPQGMWYTLKRDQFLLAKEIIRKKELYRREKTGQQVQVLKRKTFGEDCQDCRDKSSGIITNSRCLSCYGTGKLGGYYEKINTLAEITDTQSVLVPTEVGTMEPRVAMISLTYPMVSKGDVIIDKTNKRWFVNSVVRQIIRGFPVDQNLRDAKMIPPTDIVYEI